MSSDEQLQFRTSQAAIRRRLPFRVQHALTLKIITVIIVTSAFLAIATIAEVLYVKKQGSRSPKGTPKNTPVFAFLALIPDNDSMPEGEGLYHSLYRSSQKQYRFYARYHRKVKSSTDRSALQQRYLPANVTSTEAETDSSSGNHSNVVSQRRQPVTGGSTSNARKPLNIVYKSNAFAVGQSNSNASTVRFTVALSHPTSAQVSDNFSLYKTSTSAIVPFTKPTLENSTKKTNYSGSANSQQGSTFYAGRVILDETVTTTLKPTALLPSTVYLKTQTRPVSAPSAHVSSREVSSDAAARASTIHWTSKGNSLPSTENASYSRGP